MKRPQKPFVVEHKRRTRTATDAPPSIWSGSVGREMRSLVEAGDVADAMPEGAAPGIGQSGDRSGGENPPRPLLAVKARILEARAEPVPAEPEPEPEFEPDPALERPAAPRRPRGRPRKIPADAPAASPKLPKAPRDWSREAWAQEDDVEEPAAPSAPPAALPAETAQAPLSDTAPKRLRPTLRERRLEAQKKLPIGQRWKWPLKV